MRKLNLWFGISGLICWALIPVRLYVLSANDWTIPLLDALGFLLLGIFLVLILRPTRAWRNWGGETSLWIVSLSLTAIVLEVNIGPVRFSGWVFLGAFFLSRVCEARFDLAEKKGEQDYNEIELDLQAQLREIADQSVKTAVVGKLWDRIAQIDNVMTQNFELVIVGIGALFFAYGQTYNMFHLRVTIGFVGLGASLIAVMTFYNLRQDRKYLENALKEEPLRNIIKASANWRDVGVSRVLYFGASRLILYLSIILLFIWSSIVIEDLLYAFGVSIGVLTWVWYWALAAGLALLARLGVRGLKQRELGRVLPKSKPVVPPAD